MTSDNVEKATAIGAEVGWAGREARFEFFVRHPHCEAFAAEVDGGVVGVGFGTRNGSVGWIGLVCVSPSHQRQGIGTALTARIAERLEDLGCRTLALTATDLGRPIYESLGFWTETFYHGLSGPGLEPAEPHPGVRRMEPTDITAVCDLDLRLTGEDRSHLLRAFGPAGWLATGGDGRPRGYHLRVPWGGGPIVAEDFEAATTLVRFVRTLAGPDESVNLWLAAENEGGRDHMRSIGFDEDRRLPRMVRGEPPSWRPESLWGVFSLAKG